ncbi:hypothetical protein ABZ914_23675, partial [Spirillospora sp. NPDC046719]
MTGQSTDRTSGYRERNSTADRALDILLMFEDSRLVVGGQEVADHLGVAGGSPVPDQQIRWGKGVKEVQRPAGVRR